MGKMKNGIRDAFSGSIGRMVGTSWRLPDWVDNESWVTASGNHYPEYEY